MSDEVKPQLCSRCCHDEGDPDEAIPQRFMAWIEVVCHACARKLRVLNERYDDQEAARRDFT